MSPLQRARDRVAEIINSGRVITDVEAAECRLLMDLILMFPDPADVTWQTYMAYAPTDEPIAISVLGVRYFSHWVDTDEDGNGYWHVPAGPKYQNDDVDGWVRVAQIPEAIARPVPPHD